GVEQDLLDVANYRCVIDLDRGGVALRFGSGLGQVRGHFLVGQLFQVDACSGQQVADYGPELVVLHHDRLNVQPGLELDLVHRRSVGRVGDGHEQAVAALIQGQRSATLKSSRVDKLDRQVIRFE